MSTDAGLFVPTVVGSMPKPQWLYRQAREGDACFAKMARGGAGEAPRIWTMPEGPERESMQDDATRLAVMEQDLAGIEIVSDGEQRRTNYIDHVMARMGGFDMENKHEKTMRAGRFTGMVPQCVGPITHPGPKGCVLDDLKYLKSVTNKRVKVTLPAPMTVCDSSFNAHYATEREQGLAWAAAVNAEAKLLAAAGADVVQFDEPCASRYPEKLVEWGIEALDRCCEGLEGLCQTAVHVCYGYPHPGVQRPVRDVYEDIIAALETSKIDALALEFQGPGLKVEHLKLCPSKTVLFGAVFNGGTEVEQPEAVAERLLSAAQFLPPSQLQVAPDCGMVTLPQDVARAKLKNMVLGCDIARRRWLETHPVAP